MSLADRTRCRRDALADAGSAGKAGGARGAALARQRPRAVCTIPPPLIRKGRFCAAARGAVAAAADSP